MDKIELIFNIYKDSVVVSKPFKREMIKRYRLSDEEIRNLYIRIQNYQIDNFGERLMYQERAYVESEKKIVNRQATQRKYYNRRIRNRNALDIHFGNVMGQIDDLCKQAKELNK